MRMKLPARISPSTRGLWLVAVAVALIVCPSSGWSGPFDRMEQVRSQSSVPWQASQIIQPEQLAKSLSAAKDERPMVICVGFPVLYQGAHIVGARFAGPASKPEGIRKLKGAVQDVSKDKEIVVYCGCCPWRHCPNIRPAFRTLHDLGFTNVEVLSIPTNFHQDWVAKGFPIEKGPEKE